MSLQDDSKQRPIKSFRAGPIEGSVWRNELISDGQTVVRYSVRIQKQYRKEDGEYENTNYYFPSDLPKLILVARKAFEFVALTESQETDNVIPV